MVQDKLTPYWVRMNTKKKPGISVDESDYFDLTDFSDTNEGFADYDTFAHYLYDRLMFLHDSGYYNEEADKTLTARQIHHACPGDPLSTSDCHTIEAVLSYGKLGRPGDHLDTEEWNNSSHSPDDLREEDARASTTSAENRLYFAFCLSESEPYRGMAVFHNYGNTGAKSIFYGFLKRGLTSCYVKPATDDGAGLTFHMNTIASRSLVEQLVDDTLTGFELVQRKVPSEDYLQESDVFGGSKDAKVTYTIEKERFSLDQEGARELVSLIQNNEYPYAELLQDNNADNEVDRVNAIIESTGDHNRKRRLTQDNLRVEEIISEQDIEFDEEGHILMSSIGCVARNLINEQLSAYDAPELDDSRSLLGEE